MTGFLETPKKRSGADFLSSRAESRTEVAILTDKINKASDQRRGLCCFVIPCTTRTILLFFYMLIFPNTILKTGSMEVNKSSELGRA